MSRPTQLVTELGLSSSLGSFRVKQSNQMLAASIQHLMDVKGCIRALLVTLKLYICISLLMSHQSGGQREEYIFAEPWWRLASPETKLDWFSLK